MLRELRDAGRLTPDFLAVLPNDGDDLAECCHSLRSAMIEAMRKETLVPAHDKGHAPASQLVRGPQQIRSVIDAATLSWLAKAPEIQWAAGVMANSRQEKLLETLSIGSWGWDELLRCAEDRFYERYSGAEQAEGFLAGQSDGWMQKFYALLGLALQHWRYNDFGYLDHWGGKFVDPRDWAVVRTNDGQHRKGGDVFWPEGREDHDLGGVTLVKAELLRGKDKDRRERAIAFLKLVGVREVGRRERIMSLLNTHYSPQKASVTCADNAEHMRLFLDYFNDTKDVDLFSGHPIFIDKERKSLGNGSRYYLDSPFAETGLASVFDVLNYPNARRGLWDGYLKVVDGGFLDFARRLGVIDSLPIETCSTCGNPNCHQLRHYGYRTRRTSTETDRDYTIPHLELLLQQKDREVSRCLWMTMSRAPADVLKASYSPNQDTLIHEAPSLLVQNLRRFPWVLCVEGGFHRPEEMTSDSLPDDFPFDNRNGWLDAVEFGKANRQRIEEEKRQSDIWPPMRKPRQFKAEELGVSLEVVDLLHDFTPDQREQANEGNGRGA